MAMNKDTLGTKWAQDILAMSGQSPNGPAFAKMKEFWTTIADDLIQHIQSNAVVQPGIPVSTSAGSGSTSGTGTIR